MEQWMERMYLQIRNMGGLFFIPFVAYYVLIPFFTYITGMHPVYNLPAIDRLSDVCYSIIPAVSVWWVYLQLRTYLENGGGEVFLLSGGILWQTFLFFVLNGLCLVPLFVWGKYADEPVGDLYLQMLVISFLLSGMALFFVFTLKSLPVSMLLVLAFHLLSSFYIEEIAEYQYWGMMGESEWGVKGIEFMLAGIIFWISGGIAARKI